MAMNGWKGKIGFKGLQEQVKYLTELEEWDTLLSKEYKQWNLTDRIKDIFQNNTVNVKILLTILCRITLAFGGRSVTHDLHEEINIKMDDN